MDAGDVVIIDAEVESGDDGTGDTNIESTDISTEIEMVVKLLQDFTQAPEEDILASESFSDMLSGLIGAIRDLTVKVAKYANRIYRFSRNKISKTFLRLQTVHALWNRKISRNLADVDVDRLSELEIEAFPYDTWIDAAKLSLAAFEMVLAADRVVTEPGDEAVTNSMRRFGEKLNSLGIQINIPKNRMNVDALLDQRRFESITSLGYSKSQIPNCLRYFGEIAKRVPKGDLNVLEASTNKVVNFITQFASAINTAVEEGRLRKGSKEYNAELEKLLNYTVRQDFILTCMKCCYFLFDRLTADILHVFEKYETALTNPEFI
jgi:hypothetical protein